MPGPARQLGAAREGYVHQGVLVACALVALHFPHCSDTSVRSDAKLHPGDLFDDLTVDGTECRRRQIKRHDPRPLMAADLRTKEIEFRIDDVVASFLADEPRASEYRLVTTFGDPDEGMAECLVEDPDLPASSPGLPTRRFRLSAGAIWPEGGEPIWTPLCGTDRAAFVAFCDVFVIETGCPPSSLGLREPGELETHLISLLETRLGLGRPPNASRDLADAAAHLIFLATSARTRNKQPLGPDHVTTALALNTDYGRVSELLPIDPISKAGEGFRAPIEQTLESWSAVVLASSANEAVITNKLPIGLGDVLRWCEVPKDSAPPIVVPLWNSGTAHAVRAANDDVRTHSSDTPARFGSARPCRRPCRHTAPVGRDSAGR